MGDEADSLIIAVLRKDLRGGIGEHSIVLRVADCSAPTGLPCRVSSRARLSFFLPLSSVFGTGHRI